MPHPALATPAEPGGSPMLHPSSKSKEQRKKLQKRCSKGLVTTHSLAVECVRHGVYTKPAVAVQLDRSRSASRHQVTLGELRSLLLALFSDGAAIPKYLSVTNKALIRNVFNIHVTDAADPQALLRDVLSSTAATPHVYSARVCRGSENMDGESASTRLLSLSKEDIASAGCAPTPGADPNPPGSIRSYVLSEEVLRTWGFPLPVPAEPSPDSEAGRKRKLQEGEEGGEEPPVGVRLCKHRDAVPSMAQATALLAAAPSLNGRYGIAVCYSSRGAAAAVREEGYFKTLPLASACHERLRAALGVGASSGEPAVVAVDCEMCETAGGSALTRVTLVDSSSRVLLDTYVLPAEPIVDYHTQYSGIDADALAGVTVSLLQAQLAVLRIVAAETVLVGHSLENDLKALKIVHERVVDTSVLFPHPRGYPFRRGLRALAEEYLKISIQGGAGHDSAEDARAALLLVQEKARRGPLFGLPSTSSKNPHNREPLVDVVDRAALGYCKLIVCHQSEAQLFLALAGRSGTALAADWPAGRAGLLAFARDSLVAVDPSSSSLEADCRKVSLCYFCCSAAEASAAELSQLFTELRDVVRESSSSSSNYPSSSLLLLTAQAPLAAVAELSRQKKACADPRAAAAWNEALEERLRAAAKSANYAALHIEMLS